MRLGAYLAHLSPGPPYELVSWARRLAAAGFDSLWAPEVVGRGGLVPDPFVAVAVAATATEGVEVGTATVQVPLHHPAELAHRIRSLLVVCGTRLTLGVSPGSTATDYALLDQDYRARFRTFDAHVATLREHLGADTPPLLLGSWGKNVEKAAERFDGWIASGYRSTPTDIVAALTRFRAAGGGRALVTAVPVTDLEAARADLRTYADAGFDDAIVVIEPDGPDPEAVRALLP